MVKKIIKRAINGAVYGCVILTAVGVMGTLATGEGFLSSSKVGYVGNVVISILCGIAFSVPAVIYDFEKIPLWLKTVIHMGIGFLVYFPCAYYADWIPTGMGKGIIITTILFMFAGSFLVWGGFYFYYKKKDSEINKRIHDIGQNIANK